MMNSKEKLNELFKLIREEQVCLWVGAGFSLYAGYPSARSLKEIILQELKGLNIDEGKELIDVTEAFVTEKGPKKLQKLIVEVFSIEPKDTTYHNILAKIPHFNTIITTNYDQLIENAIGSDKCVVIRSSRDISRTSEKKTHIFKIHGDITRPKKLVLTKTNYSDLYNKDNKSPFWAAITKEIASKHMLFLGYGYEDPNIWAEFSYIDKKLGKFRRNKFLVAPGFDELKTAALKQKGITYVDMTGQDFVMTLEKHLKDNVVFDVEAQLTRTDTGLNFLRVHGLLGDLISGKHGHRVENIRGEDGNLDYNIRIETNDDRLRDTLNGNWQGQGGIEFTFTKQNVTDIEVRIKEFLVFRFDKFDRLSVTQVPFWKGEIHVEFLKKDMCFEGLKAEFYNLNKLTRITISKNGFEIEIDLILKGDDSFGYHFKFRTPKVLLQISHALEFFQALNHFTNGESLMFYSIDLPNGVPYSPPKIKENVQIREFLEKYRSLRTLEKYFLIKFTEIIPNHIDRDLQKIKILESLVTDGWAVADGDDILINYEEGSYEKIKRHLESIGLDQFMKCTYLDKPWNVLGTKIEVGECQALIKGPRIIEADLEKRIIRIRSIDEKIYLKYERNELVDFEQS